MIKIGSKQIPTNIFLAPLAGCSDLSFRLIAREYGAGFCFLEMIDSKSLTYKHKKTLDILSTTKEDSPLGAQLLGNDPYIMAEAAGILLKSIPHITFIDINSACPVPKVLKKKTGAWLLNKPERLSAIIKKMVSAVQVPITVKLRTGYKEKNIKKIISIAKSAQEHGASALFIHGRIMTQRYNEDIDYSSIKEIKDAVKIPVFGSGNILNANLAKRMFDLTGCDGILVARGAFGNPWIFQDIENYLKSARNPMRTEEDIFTPRNITERKGALLKHLSLINKHALAKCPYTKIGIMRKTAMWYIKQMPRAARIRQNITNAKTYEELLQVIILSL